MVVAACFGMATKYAEGLLAIKYRVIDEDGHALGGPFYYIENGMGEKWKWLAKLFAFFGFTAGIQRIANVASFVVPAMMVTYVVIGVAIILYNITDIPHAIVVIVEDAFGAKAVAGGALGAVMVAMQKGVARGIFSNEAGLGSAPIAAAAAQTKEPVRQGLVSMTGTFLDTIVICNITGFAIVLTGSDKVGLEGVAVTMRAFGKGLPWPDFAGGIVLMICLSIFAYTTILGWDYYGERCLEYFSNKNMKAVKVYRWIYIIAVLIGPFLTLNFVWTFADIFNGLMALPNLVGLVALNGVVVAETRSYFKRLNAGEVDEGSKFRKKVPEAE